MSKNMQFGAVADM